MEAFDDDDELLFSRPTAGEYRTFFDSICDIGLGEPRYREAITKATLRQCRSWYGKLCRLFPLGEHASTRHTRSVSLEILASDSLSGGPYPCIETSCRSASADVGARFAALYADHIVVRDPLGVHESDDRARLLSAMAVLYMWKPLFEAGIASHVVRICSHCAASQLARLAKVPADIPRIAAKIARRFAKAQFTVHRLGRTSAYVDVKAPGELAHGNGGYEYTGKAAQPLLKMLGRGKSAPLTLAAAKSTGAMERVTAPIVHEFLMQQLHRMTSSLDAHYASDMPIDLELANSLAPASVRWPRGLIDALAHTVPIVAHAPVKDLVRFRVSEPSTFQRYRSHVRAVAENAHDPKALRDAADSLRSDYAALDHSLRLNRSGLFRKTRNELVLFGSIGIGLAATFGSPALLALLAAPALRTVTEAVRPRLSDDVQKHPLYFLWRLRNR